MKAIFKFTLTILLIFCGFVAKSQYRTNGSAIKTATNCYNLTTANGQAGSVWNMAPFNLTSSFQLTYNARFSSPGVPNDGGGDGTTFTLQSQGLTALGGSGGAVGYNSVSPSVGIKFDTFFNNGFGDPTSDFIGIYSGGNANNAVPATPKVQASPTSTNIEDGNLHAVRINWNSATTTLEVYFDGSLRISFVNDIVTNYLGGNPVVYWGFTAGSGSSFNFQSVCGINFTPPQIYNIETAPLTYTEKQAAQSISQNIIISEAGGPNITGATVQIISGLEKGEDRLRYVDNFNFYGVFGIWDASLGRLTLSGTTTVARYQEIIRSIGFENFSTFPSNTPRVVQISSISDGTNTSNTLTRQINVIPVNDPPVAVPDKYTLLEGASLIKNIPGVISNDYDLDSKLRIANAPSPIIADGIIDDTWENIHTYPITYNAPYAPIPTAADLSGSYKVMWDNNNLYVIAEVHDDIIINDGTVLSENWMDDAVEIFIDKDNSKSSSYDINDFQIIFGYGDTTPSSTKGDMSAATFSHVDTPDGYIMEMIIPWSLIGGVPAPNVSIGFEVQIDDDDNGGGRDGKISWHDPYDETWKWPFMMGTGTIFPGIPAIPSTAIMVTPPVNGSVVLNSDGSFTYTHNGGETTKDSLTYKLNDGIIDGNTTKVLFNITPVNDAPIAAADLFILPEDTEIARNVLTNDNDAEGNTLTVSLVSPTSNGVLTLNPDGTFTYKPNVNYNGNDNFTYQVCDNQLPSLCSQANVAIIINSVNDAPVGVNDSAIVVQTEVLTGNVLSNDSDVDGTLTANSVLVVQPLYGSVVLNANGSYQYTPVVTYTGNDKFTYQACDNGSPSICITAEVILLVLPYDSDKDSIPDKVEYGPNPLNPKDSDGDGTPDYLDTDSDNDNIPDAVEAGPNPTIPVDTDKDGTPDYLDNDSDNDGFPDIEEAGMDPLNPVDTDGDGMPDYRDADSDGDGKLDAEEGPGDCNANGITNRLDANEICNEKILIPQGFSPNGDGNNDFWNIRLIEEFPNNKVKVFNNWGSMVFETKGYNNGTKVWNGYSNSTLVLGNYPLPDGTYFYTIDLGDGSKVYSGFVVINK